MAKRVKTVDDSAIVTQVLRMTLEQEEHEIVDAERETMKAGQHEKNIDC